MKKILITGSNSLIGQKIQQFLLHENNYYIIPTSKSKNLFSQLNERFELLDISNFSNVDYIIKFYKPDVLINTAAISQPDQCEIDKQLCWEINFEAVKNIVNISKKTNIHLIHFSTDFVFNGLKDIYYETDTPSPINFYGYSKAEADKYIIDNIDYFTIIRPILVYGYMKTLPRQNLVLKLYCKVSPRC